jgi:hypothetical protein
MRFQNITYFIIADKFAWIIFERHSAAQGVRGRKPEKNRVSSKSSNTLNAISHWIAAYIDVCCPSGQPLAVQIQSGCIWSRFIGNDGT